MSGRAQRAAPPRFQEFPIKSSLTPFAAAALLALAAASASGAPTYRIKDLGVGPGGYSSQGLAINDNNVVVGWIQTERYGPHYAAIFQPDAIVNLGQVAGDSGYSSSPKAFIYDSASGMQPLGTLDPAHPYSVASGISDNGTVVGQSKNAAGVPHAFVWTAKRGMMDPAPGEAGWADASAINSRGQWVGHQDRTDATIGVLVNGKRKVTNLGYLDASAPYSYGKGLNEVGQVAGYSADPVTFASRAFVWDRATGMTDIGILPGGFYSNGLAVNNAGQVVGIADKPGGRSTVNGPFYYDKQTGIVDLATLVDPADPLYGQVEFDAAQDINNNGVIVANGIRNDKYHAYLLIPVR